MAERELRKQKISIKRHEQILNAATEIFVQKGYTDATIQFIFITQANASYLRL
jgi:AcrR family transcriptional regulator